MKYAAILPGNRSVLFANLGRYWPGKEAGDPERLAAFWKDVARYSPACFRAELEALAEQAAAGEVVTAQLTQSTLFLPWEQRMLALALAIGRPREGFARVCDAYVPVARSGRALIWQMLFIYGLFWLALMVVVSLSVGPLGTRLAVLAGLGVLAVVLAPALGKRLMALWIDPESALWTRLQSFSLGRSVVVTRSLYQYLLNLGWCIQAGMDVRQSAALSAETEPRAALRARYQQAARAVAEGQSLSKAFVLTGVLQEARLVSAPTTQSGGKLWEPGVTDVVRQSWEEQLRWVATMLPVAVGLVVFTALLLVTLLVL